MRHFFLECDLTTMEVIRLIRSIRSLGLDFPLVVLSHGSGELILNKALENGEPAWFIKSIDADSLTHELRSALSRESVMAEPDYCTISGFDASGVPTGNEPRGRITDGKVM